MSTKKCNFIYPTERPIVNRLPILEEEGVFFRKHHYESKKNNNVRRSSYYGAIAPNMDPEFSSRSSLQEATPLLLQSRLSELVTPPTDHYKRVGKVLGKAGEL